MVGLFYGLTLLSEYAAAIIFFPLVISLFMQKEEVKIWIKELVIGGLVPGLFWCWYHISSFGSPFQTAIQHENPIFFEGIEHGELLFGMFSTPSWNVLIELLFGTSRGILFTQPWILVLLFIIPWMFFSNKDLSQEKKSVLVFSWVSLILMVLMNSSFNGWHGGMTAGPRYLSIALAPFGLLVGCIWNDFKKPIHILLFITLLLSIEFRGRVFATTILAPSDQSLWKFQWDIILDKNKHLIRYILYYVIFLGMGFWAFKREKKVTSM
jgi:hypothetical protein